MLSCFPAAGLLSGWFCAFLCREPTKPVFKARHTLSVTSAVIRVNKIHFIAPNPPCRHRCWSAVHVLSMPAPPPSIYCIVIQTFPPPPSSLTHFSATEQIYSHSVLLVGRAQGRSQTPSRCLLHLKGGVFIQLSPPCLCCFTPAASRQQETLPADTQLQKQRPYVLSLYLSLYRDCDVDGGSGLGAATLWFGCELASDDCSVSIVVQG